MSLLPPNSTPIERALEKSIKLEELPVPIDTIRDPWKCPVQFLELSAWENRVGFWNDNWPEMTKRKVIASNWEVKKYSGTTYGLEVALGALDFGTQVTEWFDYGGEAGYFNLDVELFDRGITADEQNDILAIAGVAKRESQHLDTLTLHLASKGDLPTLSCVTCTGHTIDVFPLIIPDLESQENTPFFALGTHTVHEINIYPKVTA